MHSGLAVETVCLTTNLASDSQFSSDRIRRDAMPLHCFQPDFQACMEIHHPDAPIHSIKEFLVHLSLVTIGILIALALEGAVAALHHRHLVAEAEENMQTEIADNRSQLEAALARAPLG